MPDNAIENKNSKNLVKWTVGVILAGILLAGGGYLVYRFWFKKSPELVQQEQEKKTELCRQIKLIREKIAHTKNALEEKKMGHQYKFEPFDESLKEIDFSSPDKEAKELLEEKIKVWNEYRELNDKIREIISHKQNQAIKNENDKNLVVWNKQKNGNWRILTDRLDKDPTVKAKFHHFIVHFYHRYKELKKNIPTHPSINFKGFGYFYIDEGGESGIVTEMGNAGHPDGEKINLIREGNGPWMVKDYPIWIKLNQLYLLNNGRNPGGRMDQFFYKEPKSIPGGTIQYLEISSDKLIETIAHEIAHTFQTAKNLSDDKLRSAGTIGDDGKEEIEFSEPLSDCFESGEGRRDEEHKLIEPKNPKLVKEHKQFEIEIKQMIKEDPLFQDFIAWWEANS